MIQSGSTLAALTAYNKNSGFYDEIYEQVLQFSIFDFKNGKEREKVEMSKIRFEQILEIWNEIKCQK